MMTMLKLLKMPKAGTSDRKARTWSCRRKVVVCRNVCLRLTYRCWIMYRRILRYRSFWSLLAPAWFADSDDPQPQGSTPQSRMLYTSVADLSI